MTAKNLHGLGMDGLPRRGRSEKLASSYFAPLVSLLSIPSKAGQALQTPGAGRFAFLDPIYGPVIHFSRFHQRRIRPGGGAAKAVLFLRQTLAWWA